MNIPNQKPLLQFLALVILAVVLAGTITSLAQAPAPAPTTTGPAAAAPPPGATGTMGKEMTLWEWFVIGGWCMWPLLACSIAGIALIIRNEMALQSKKLLVPDVISQIEATLHNLNIAEGRQICQANPTLITNILDVGLERVEVHGSVDVDVMSKAMEEASTEQMASYIMPINFVNTIAVVAPMLGLLGTVSGMIKAFFTIGLGGMGKPELLANNIGEALITTEAGLIIAIPAMGYYFYCKNKFIANVASAGKSLGKLMDGLRTAAQNAQ